MAAEKNNAKTSKPAAPASSMGDPTLIGPDTHPPQMQLRVDENDTRTFYSSTSRISSSAEEMIIDFSQGIRQVGQPPQAVLKIDARMILSPWAAKRLALALGQTIQRYERTYGLLEIDPRKRQLDAPPGS